MQKDLAAIFVEAEPLQKGEYSISDLARTYGVTLRTLRFYEDKGLLHPRRQATSRFYSASDRVRLELIIKGKKLGFTLAEISELISRTKKTDSRMDGENADLIVNLDAKQIVAQIAHLERQRDELDGAIAELRGAHMRMSRPVG